MPREELVAGPSEHTKAYLTKAIEKWNLIVEQMPKDAPAMPMTHYFLARAYYHLGDYEKAERYCTAFVQGWPAHELAWEAQFLIAEMAKRSIQEKGVPESEAEAKMAAAFAGLLDKYPNCPAATIAREWLANHQASSLGGDQ